MVPLRARFSATVRAAPPIGSLIRQPERETRNCFRMMHHQSNAKRGAARVV
jgi:hypothetical protein